MGLNRDLEIARSVIKGYSSERIYAKTNEDLKQMFYDVDFKDKDVFSVLASSDQVFSAYYAGALNVDTFDINSLTKYYYYLRKWGLDDSLEIDPKHFDDRFIRRLIDTVEVNSEEEMDAKEFWSYLLEISDDLINGRLFFNFGFNREKNFDYDIEGLKDKMKDKKLNFQQLDIFKPMEVTKQYDVVVMSNILEHSSRNNQLVICRNNLEKLVKEDGIVICSNLIYHNFKDKKMERIIFEKQFDFIKGKGVGNYGGPSYYVYKKK